jgi:hypothetical protein
MHDLLQSLGEEGIRVVVGALLIGLLSIGAAVLGRNLKRSGKVWIGVGAGRTCMSPLALLVCLMCAAAAAAVLALGLWDRRRLLDPGQLYAWLALAGAFAASALAIAPFTRQTWEWDAAGLTWQGARRSTSLRWPEIVRLGKTWDGRFYAADAAGTRITWSQITLEHEALLRAILTARPDLKPPP